MSGRYLLDTNIAIGVLNRQVDLEARRGSGAEVFLALTVVGELLFGAAKSQKLETNRARIESLIERCPVLAQDLDTALHYGTLRAELARQGQPIPENDIWIAACARQYGLTLATRDRHFDAVDGLEVEAWWATGPTTVPEPPPSRPQRVRGTGADVLGVVRGHRIAGAR